MRLDAHARDKFLRLVGEERYDYTTDLVTITSDRLPYRKQNRDYCEYLIKVRYIVQGYWISNHCCIENYSINTGRYLIKSLIYVAISVLYNVLYTSYFI